MYLYFDLTRLIQSQAGRIYLHHSATFIAYSALAWAVNFRGSTKKILSSIWNDRQFIPPKRFSIHIQKIKLHVLSVNAYHRAPVRANLLLQDSEAYITCVPSLTKDKYQNAGNVKPANIRYLHTLNMNLHTQHTFIHSTI